MISVVECALEFSTCWVSNVAILSAVVACGGQIRVFCSSATPGSNGKCCCLGIMRWCIIASEIGLLEAIIIQRFSLIQIVHAEPVRLWWQSMSCIKATSEIIIGSWALLVRLILRVGCRWLILLRIGVWCHLVCLTSLILHLAWGHRAWAWKRWIDAWEIVRFACHLF